MKFSRLQKRLLALILANVLLIAFLGFNTGFINVGQEERISIRSLGKEMYEIESRLIDLEVILIDAEEVIEKSKAKKTDLKTCLSSKVLELGNRKIGAAELNLLIRSCYEEAKF